MEKRNNCISPLQRKVLTHEVFTFASEFLKIRIMETKEYLEKGNVFFSKTYPSFLTLKEGSTFLSKPLFPQEREDVAGSAIAPPGFWSPSGACAHKGLAGSAYATELRLFDAITLRLLYGWRIA